MTNPAPARAPEPGDRVYPDRITVNGVAYSRLPDGLYCRDDGLGGHCPWDIVWDMMTDAEQVAFAPRRFSAIDGLTRHYMDGLRTALVGLLRERAATKTSD